MVDSLEFKGANHFLEVHLQQLPLEVCVGNQLVDTVKFCSDLKNLTINLDLCCGDFKLVLVSWQINVRVEHEGMFQVA